MRHVHKSRAIQITGMSAPKGLYHHLDNCLDHEIDHEMVGMGIRSVR